MQIRKDRMKAHFNLPRALFLCLVACGILSAATAPLGSPDARYHLKVNDRIDLTYRLSPEYNQSVTVQPDGYVTLRLIGEMKLEGLTLDEVRSRIIEEAGTRLHDPELTVSLQEYVRPAFTVSGWVGTPGRYEIHGNVTALEAIAMAGGLKDTAKHSQVLWLRKTNEGKTVGRVLDVKRLTSPSHPRIEEVGLIQPGDILFVPKNTVSKIGDYIHWVSLGAYVPL